MEYISQVFVGVLVGTFTAVFAIHRFIHERWWERKWEAYSEILSALCDAAQYSEQQCEIYASMGTNVPDSLISKTEYLAAVWKIKKLENIGAFVVQKSAIQILEDLPYAATGDWDGESGEIFYGTDQQAFTTAIAKLRKIACNDLKKNDFFSDI